MYQQSVVQDNYYQNGKGNNFPPYQLSYQKSSTKLEKPDRDQINHFLIAWEIKRLHQIIEKESKLSSKRKKQIKALKDQIVYQETQNKLLMKSSKPSAFDGQYIVDELKKLQNDNFLLQEEIKDKNQQLKSLKYRLSPENSNLKRKIEQYKNELFNFKSREQDMISYQKKIEDDLYRSQQQIKNLKNELNQLTSEKNLLDTQLKAQITELETKIDLIEVLKDKLLRSRKKGENDYDQRQLITKQNQGTINQLKEREFKLLSELRQNKFQLAVQQKTIKSLKEQIKKFESKMPQLSNVHQKLINIINDKEKSMKGMKWIEEELRQSQVVNQKLEEDIIELKGENDRIRMEKQVLMQKNEQQTVEQLTAKDKYHEENTVSLFQEIDSLKNENKVLILNLDKLTKLQQQEEHQRKLKENTINQVIQKVQKLINENQELRKQIMVDQSMYNAKVEQQMNFFNEKSQKLIHQMDQLGNVIGEQKHEIEALQQRLIEQETKNLEHIELLKKDYESQLVAKDQLEMINKVEDKDQINLITTKAETLENKNKDLRNLFDTVQVENRNNQTQIQELKITNAQLLEKIQKHNSEENTQIQTRNRLYKQVTELQQIIQQKNKEILQLNLAITQIKNDNKQLYEGMISKVIGLSFYQQDLKTNQSKDELEKQLFSTMQKSHNQSSQITNLRTQVQLLQETNKQNKQQIQNISSQRNIQKSQRFLQYKLTYFKKKYFKGEYLRIALILNKANWENNQLDEQEWMDFKQKTPNGQLPVLQVNQGAMMDEVLPLLRYICMNEGLYPQKSEDIYQAERLVSIIYECRIDTEEINKIQSIQGQVKFMNDKCLKDVPAYLTKIVRNCGENIKRTGFVANNQFSIADVVLLAWLSFTVGNPTRLKEMTPLLQAQPTLEYYWNFHKEKINDYLESRPLALF